MARSILHCVCEKQDSQLHCFKLVFVFHCKQSTTCLQPSPIPKQERGIKNTTEEKPKDEASRTDHRCSAACIFIHVFTRTRSEGQLKMHYGSEPWLFSFFHPSLIYTLLLLYFLLILLPAPTSLNVRLRAEEPARLIKKWK